jgi:predicted nuclease of restriction endonuclease-like (RecB) superfamily
MAKRSKKTQMIERPEPEYGGLLTGISDLLDQARRMSARTVNNILTATYWEIGRRIVEYEQGGQARAEYAETLMEKLAQDLTARHGRGFSVQGLYKMRGFYLGWEICSTPSSNFEARAKLPPDMRRGSDILPTPSGELEARAKVPTASGESALARPPIPFAFPLSWSHYVRLMSVQKPHARAFYEAEAIRGGWSVRQLDRQISTQFFERTSHSKQQAAMLARGQRPKPEDAISVHDEIRDPYLLEFLDLKDEYSESELEEALVRHLEWFLLELGAGFTFVARQKRIRIGDHYAMGGIKAKVFASHYLTDLPDPETLRQEIVTTQHALATRAMLKGPDHGKT